jgi:predicted nucleic acid-binding protein
MILVDTSVWIDHLHRADARLAELLAGDNVGAHAWVIEELALGSMKDRVAVIESLGSLWLFPVLTHSELLDLVVARQLWGRGLSAVDAHLLGSVLITAGARLWTRDKRLREAAVEVGVAFDA